MLSIIYLVFSIPILFFPILFFCFIKLFSVYLAGLVFIWVINSIIAFASMLVWMHFFKWSLRILPFVMYFNRFPVLFKCRSISWFCGRIEVFSTYFVFGIYFDFSNTTKACYKYNQI